MAKLPIEPVTPERRGRLLATDGYIILGHAPGDNSFQGFVEHSFSMAWDKRSVNFFWSGAATSNFGTKHVLDGKANAEEYVKKERLLHPDWQIEAWSVRDPTLPVTLDWDRWVEAHAYNPNTMSGVTDKFAARNFRFEMRDADYEVCPACGKLTHVGEGNCIECGHLKPVGKEWDDRHAEAEATP